MQKETEDWFVKQESLTITVDIGTTQGLSLLVLLMLSEKDKTVKIVGINPIICKSGVYIDQEIFKMSRNNLDIPEDVIKTKVSGMAGDGALCKDNAPFKS